jgi:hypothetical protein
VSITTEPLTNRELAEDCFDRLTSRGVDSDTAAQIVSGMYPAGHQELSAVLDDDPGALTWLPALWTETFAQRFRCYSDADAAEIQRLLAAATR